MAIDLNVLVTAALALYRIDENLRDAMRSLEPDEMESLTETLVALGKIPAPEPRPNPILVDYHEWVDGADIQTLRDTTQHYLEALSDLPEASEIDSVQEATSAERKAAMLELNEAARKLLGLS